MESRLRRLKLLSHGSWLPRVRKQALGKSTTKLILGSISLGLIGSLMGGLVSCSSAPSPSNNSQTTPSPAPSPSSSIAASPLFSSPDLPSPNSQIPNNQSPDKGDATKSKPANPAITKDPKSQSPAAKNTVAINIYQADNQCNDFIPEKVNLPANNSLEMAVAKVIEKSNINEFSLAASKVTTDLQTGIATIDFQVAANSKRRFVSLSSCEQFNLFGSLRKTLIDNPDWQIKDVRFTEGGKELVL